MSVGKEYRRKSESGTKRKKVGKLRQKKVKEREIKGGKVRDTTYEFRLESTPITRRTLSPFYFEGRDWEIKVPPPWNPLGET